MDSPTLLCIDLPQVLESQEDSGISWLQRQARLEPAYRNEDVGGIAGHCGSLGVQTRGLGSNSVPHQATVSQSTHYFAFSVFRDAGASPVGSG